MPMSYRALSHLSDLSHHGVTVLAERRRTRRVLTDTTELSKLSYYATPYACSNVWWSLSELRRYFDVYADFSCRFHFPTEKHLRMGLVLINFIMEAIKRAIASYTLHLSFTIRFFIRFIISDVTTLRAFRPPSALRLKWSHLDKWQNSCRTSARALLQTQRGTSRMLVAKLESMTNSGSAK